MWQKGTQTSVGKSGPVSGLQFLHKFQGEVVDSEPFASRTSDLFFFHSDV